MFRISISAGLFCVAMLCSNVGLRAQLYVSGNLYVQGQTGIPGQFDSIPTLHCGGAVQVLAAGQVHNLSGEIHFYQNVDNQGLWSSSGDEVFNGPTDQSLSGNWLGGNQLYDVFIKKPFQTRLLLGNDVASGHLLRFGGGLIETGLYQWQHVNTDASSIVGAGASGTTDNYIRGRLLRHLLPGIAYSFPVGDWQHGAQWANVTATVANEASLSYSSQGSGPIYQTQVCNVVGDPLNDTLVYAQSSGSWDLVFANAPVAYQLDLLPAGMNNVAGVFDAIHSPNLGFQICANTNGNFSAGPLASGDVFSIFSGNDILEGLYNFCNSPDRIFVNDDATGANNGSTWADAFTSLQSGLAAAHPGSQIWVAEGTYKPTTGIDRSISFVLSPGISLYGGFPNNSTCNTTLENRDPELYPSVLSADIGAPGLATDNSYRVMRANNVGNSVLVDGFTLRDAYSNTYGGGLNVIASNVGGVSSPTFVNCIFANNFTPLRGGGAFVYALDGGVSSIVFNQCTFNNNNATQDCGGLGSSTEFGGVLNMTLNGCHFIQNTSVKGGGVGHLSNQGGNSNIVYTSCLFQNNIATTDAGGGAWHHSRNGGVQTYSMANCTFVGNQALNGAALAQRTLTGNNIGNISDCSFSGNASSGNGAIYLNGEKISTCNLNIVRSSFVGNASTGRGGAIAQVALSGAQTALTVGQCRFQGNSATVGGAMYYLGQNANSLVSATVSNTQFFQNTGSTNGGALAQSISSAAQGNLSYQYCSFNGNTGNTGSVAYNYGTGTGSNAILNVGNSIVWQNPAVVGKSFQTQNPRAFTTLNKCVIDFATCALNNTGTQGVFSCSGLIAANPQFTNAGIGDLHLLVGSPAIDAAISGPAIDFDGTARPFGNGFDLGAFEYDAVLPRMAPFAADAPGPSPTMLIFPNPSNGRFTIQTSEPIKGRVEVYDVQGKVLLSQDVEGLQSIDLELIGRSPGQYVVRLTSAEDALVGKLQLMAP